MGGVNSLGLDLGWYRVGFAVFASEEGVCFVIPDEGFSLAVELEMTSYDVLGLVQLHAVVLQMFLHAIQPIQQVVTSMTDQISIDMIASVRA